MTTTDVATRGGADITTREGRALSPEFVTAHPALAADVDIEALMEEAMAGGTLNLGNLTAIKVPAADLAKSFIVPDDDGNESMQKTLTGIPVSVTSRRSWWASDEVTGSAPDCKSLDLKTGIGAFGAGWEQNPTGQCSTCPMAARGSAGKGTQASACKEQRLIFLLTGDLLPLMVIVPPGSLPNFNNFGAFLFKKAIRGVPRGADPVTGRPVTSTAWLRLEVELGLEQDTNPAKQDYNKITFKVVRRLEPAEAEQANQYGLWVDSLLANQPDVIDAAMTDGTAPVEDVPFGEGDLPVDEVNLDGAPADEVPADETAAGTPAGKATSKR